MTLQLKDPSILHPSQDSTTPSPKEVPKEEEEQQQGDGETQRSATCQLCKTSFPRVEEQRLHVKSDWHNYNLKQKVRGGQCVTENHFEKLVDELDESLSGSGSESSESEADGESATETTLNALLKKQARLSSLDVTEEFMQKKPQRGSGKPPLLWFSTTLLPSNTSLGIYRALFTNAEQEEPDKVGTIRRKQLRPVQARPTPADSSPQIFLCMIGGGHFAGMIVSLAPKLGKQPSGTEQRQAIVIAHKTFHRYTTRRKQGGAQSANDSAKGAAHSAGSSLRRYNEVALEQEIRALLAEWRDLINDSQLIFIRATGSSSRRTLLGPYDNQVLRQNDPRNRTFPFSTRRATQAELMRAFVELTRVKVSEVDELALAAAAAEAAASSQQTSQSKPASSAPRPKHSREEDTATFQTSQLQALIRRSKIPGLLSYLSTNSLSPNYTFYPLSAQTNHHAPTPLHLASSIRSPVVVLALLTKAGADPAVLNGEGKPAFDLAGDRATRDAFRIARSELGEGRWDYAAAHIPAALSKSEADKRDAREKAELEKTESERRKAEEERLKREVKITDNVSKKGGRPLGVIEKTAEERRAEEGRGLTPEMRLKIERERRARAAEARFGRSGGGGR